MLNRNILGVLIRQRNVNSFLTLGIVLMEIDVSLDIIRIMKITLMLGLYAYQKHQPLEDPD